MNTALIFELERSRGARVEGLSAEAESLLEPYKDVELPQLSPTKVRPKSAPVAVGRATVAIMRDMRRKDLSFKQRLMYLFGPPGWSHDGHSMTSKEMRLQEHIKKNAAGAR